MTATITSDQLTDLTDFMYDHVATQNVDFPEADDVHSLGVFRTYSGRGMLGKECLGLVISPSDIFRVAFAISAWLEHIEADDDLREEFARVATDNMGYDTVVYWPGISVESTE